MNTRHLTVDSFDEVQGKLILPSFWELNEPCDWKPINYLSELYKSDPTLERSSAHRHLLKDVETLKKLVVPGTVAETMLNIMYCFNSSKSGKTALKKFYEHVDVFKSSGLNERISKEKVRSTLKLDVALEEEKRVQKKLKTCDTSKIDDNLATMPNSTKEEDGDEKIDNIWLLWKKFLNEAEINNYLPSLSPEKHGVIWCGPGVSCRSSFPRGLYSQTQYQLAALEQYSICSRFKKIVKATLQKTNRIDMIDCIETLRSTRSNLGEKKLLVELFTLL
ncbi:hypothetical protein A0J61_06751 [Choanephora cucurbitarum]|uniref:Uncharacterized protein n=1 Tax=Choanephora cucurbitarum TaxID=101091 RepID=A0A1C7N7U8_9FUNG|nr:hypothetical protein A0J61_06751 [Choanephora cucurbitarum]